MIRGSGDLGESSAELIGLLPHDVDVLRG